MFTVEYCFEFKDVVPNPQKIYNQLQKRVSIPLELDGNTIISPKVDGNVFVEYASMEQGFDYNGLNILSYHTKMTYLVANILLSIFELGGYPANGEYDFTNEIPTWANLSFEEARDNPGFIP